MTERPTEALGYWEGHRAGYERGIGLSAIRIADLEAERDRYRLALEDIAHDSEVVCALPGCSHCLARAALSEQPQQEAQSERCLCGYGCPPHQGCRGEGELESREPCPRCLGTGVTAQFGDPCYICDGTGCVLHAEYAGGSMSDEVKRMRGASTYVREGAEYHRIAPADLDVALDLLRDAVAALREWEMRAGPGAYWENIAADTRVILDRAEETGL